MHCPESKVHEIHSLNRTNKRQFGAVRVSMPPRKGCADTVQSDASMQAQPDRSGVRVRWIRRASRCLPGYRGKLLAHCETPTARGHGRTEHKRPDYRATVQAPL